jgi:hypothetical protein
LAFFDFKCSFNVFPKKEETSEIQMPSGTLILIPGISLRILPPNLYGFESVNHKAKYA